jgi:hypothetical protein
MVISAIVTAVETVVSAVSTVAGAIGGAIATGAGAIGIPSGVAGALGGAVTGGLEAGFTGGVLGAGEAAVTGKNVIKGFESGAETGAITGGVLGTGLGSDIAKFTGLSPGIGEALAGAAGGTLAAKAEGGNLGTGALTGGITGLLAGTKLDPLAKAGSPGTSGSGATGAVSQAAPVGVTAASPDVSQPSSVSTNLPGSVGTGAAAGGAAGTLSGGGGTDVLSGGTGSSGGGLITSTGMANPSDLTSNIPNVTLTPGGSGVTNTLDNIIGGATKNPLSAVTDIALLSDVMRGNQKPPFYNTLATQAGQDISQGRQLQGYLTGGTLPPGLQASLDAAAANAQASIKSMYASRGMSGSSAEAQDIANLNQRIVSQGTDMAVQLFNAGLSETQIGDQLYQGLMQDMIQQDQATSSAVGSLATSLAMLGSGAVAA